MSSMEREKRVKVPKFSLEGLKEARQGVSRLDQLTFDEDDNVYDVVDEEKYSNIVEERRKAADFVVDDEGLGYVDNGEEIVGVGEDRYDVKKRLKEAAKAEDAKMAKKARRLVEDYNPKNTLLRHLQPGTMNAPKLTSKTTAPQTMLDIDALLGGGGGASVKVEGSRLGVKALIPGGLPLPGRPPLPSVKRPALPPSMMGLGGGRSFASSSPSQSFDHSDEGMDLAEDNQAWVEETQPLPHSPQSDEIHQSTKQSKASSLEGPSSSEPVPSPSAPITASHEEPAKLSLTKTSKSLKLAAAAAALKTPQQTPAEDLKPLLAQSTGTGATLSFHDEAPTATEVGQKIDPKSWIQDNESEGGDSYVKMFWMDATEINGVVYLFGRVPVTGADGKIKNYVSACAVVQGCERNLFVLPRQVPGRFKENGSPLRVGMAEVYNELSHLLVPAVIPKQEGRSFRCKPVKRRYAFEYEDIPREETEYMKVVYSAKYGIPSLQQCQEGKTYERIFGAGLSPLELFLLKRQLQGPGWIKIQRPRPNTDYVSWCKVEFTVESPKLVTKLSPTDAPPNPPLTTMCISLKTVVNPSTHIHEIVALSALLHCKVDGDGETEMSTQHMKRFTFIRPLGLSCGPNYPAAFPHNLTSEVSKHQEIALQLCMNERMLLSSFLMKIQQEDPDIISSHNLLGFEMDVILSRLVVNKLANWSLLGRLRKSKPPKSVNDRDAISGRILCDTYKAAKEFLRETTYSLTYLAGSQLKKERIEVDPIDVPRYFSTSSDILNIAWHTYQDVWLVQGLMFKLQVIPLTKQLTNLSGNLWSRTIRGARAERIEYLLLHEFHHLKFILPERKFSSDNSSNSMVKKGKHQHLQQQQEEEEDIQEIAAKVGGLSRKRAKAAYAGGLVLEPKKGLYDTMILLLDFNSLYPSIIQEYNLCFTTINWPQYMRSSQQQQEGEGKDNGKKDNKKKKQKRSTGEDGEDDNDVDSGDDSEDEVVGDSALVVGGTTAAGGSGGGQSNLPPLPDSHADPGILPRVIKTLVDRRRVVKNLLKNERDPVQRQQLDIRQKALKLTANSMYGCLGFSFSRFYARPIAALVTAMGREALQRTVDLATKTMNLDVIYGDTDSVMINTNSTDLTYVKEIGNKVKREVNKLYKSLELDLDGIFRSMLLLKKKKYAALTIHELSNGEIEYEKEMKGLDLVRRDWCPLSKETGKYIVDQILSGNSREDIVLTIHDYLSDLAEKIRNKDIPLEAFIITKGLNKNPTEYPDCNGQPHLQVALQMLKASKPVNIGDHIPYIICCQHIDNSNGNATTTTTTNTTTTSSNHHNTVAQRAYHPDEVQRRSNELTIDYEWYLSTQILPPVSRLCEPIEGTSAAILSEKLGLDASKYVRSNQGGGDDDIDDSWGFTPQCQMEDNERFRDCQPLLVKCSSCHEECSVKSIMDLMESTGSSSGNTMFACSHCGAMFYGRHHASDCYCYLSNRITILIRDCLKKYYDGWLECDEHSCGLKTMQQSVRGMACIAENCHGRLKQVYDELALHSQLKYLESLFDIKRFQARKNISDKMLAEMLPRDQMEIFRLLREHMANAVNGSAYNWIRPSLWSALFGKVNTANATTDNNNAVVASSSNLKSFI